MYSIKDTNKLYLIVVPTHKLKDEIYNKAISLGITKIARTPSIPKLSDEVSDIITHTYNVGAGEYALPILRTVFSSLDKNDIDYIPLCEYLNHLDTLMEYDGHIITTHERFVCMRKNNKLLKNREVIIDEDIIRSLFNTSTINNSSINTAISSGMFNKDITDKLREISRVKGFKRFESINFSGINDELIENLKNINGNIIGLIQSSNIYVDTQNNTTTFLEKKDLPCEKAIVLSATANETIYNMLIPNKKIKYYSCSKAAYKGTVKLHPNYTYSRSSIHDNKDEIIEYVNSNADSNAEIITFQCLENDFKTSYHFGAVEGLNSLEGNNLSVIGLPNVDDIVYKLYGMATGLKIKNCNMRHKRVDYNNYNFDINTFDSIELREIQLWMIESMIEQAVGRARLLRNDCTVNVFARFPVSQATIVQEI